MRLLELPLPNSRAVAGASTARCVGLWPRPGPSTSLLPATVHGAEIQDICMNGARRGERNLVRAGKGGVMPRCRQLHHARHCQGDEALISTLREAGTRPPPPTHLRSLPSPCTAAGALNDPAVYML
jgi:hypothetical protein